MSSIPNTLSPSTANYRVSSPPQPLSKAVGVSKDAFLNTIRSTGQQSVDVKAKGFSKVDLANAFSYAVKNGKLNLNVSADSFDVQTNSNAGRQIKAVATELNLKTDGKTVKDLITAIGENTAGSKGGSLVVPTKLLNVLGQVSISAMTDKDLSKLGVSVAYIKDGFKLGVELTGKSKVGINPEFNLEGKFKDATSELKLQLKAIPGNGASATADLSTTTPNVSVKGKITASTLRGDPPVSGGGEIKIKTGPNSSIAGEVTSDGKNSSSKVQYNQGDVFVKLESKSSGKSTDNSFSGGVKVSF